MTANSVLNETLQLGRASEAENNHLQLQLKSLATTIKELKDQPKAGDKRKAPTANPMLNLASNTMVHNLSSTMASNIWGKDLIHLLATNLLLIVQGVVPGHPYSVRLFCLP